MRLSLKYCITFILTTNILLSAEFYINDYAKNSILKKQDITFQKRFDKLIVLMNQLQQKSEMEKITKVNEFFNQTPYFLDQKIWGVSDYWANTTEFIEKDMADCEDYVFAKYFVLKKLGINQNKLKSYYVKSLKYNVAHMVLGYFENPDSEPLILDNYNMLIFPASKRDDLQPVKLFDTEKLLVAKYKQFGLVVPNDNNEALIWLEHIQGIIKK